MKLALTLVVCALLPLRAADPPVPEMFGIGIRAIATHGNLGVTIHEILPDGPAAKAVLRPGLIIVRADGIPLEDKPLDRAVKFLRGPADSIARLEVKDPKDGSITKVDVRRERIPLPATKRAPGDLPKL
jgi:C-terminal processing protease CtpA/Prc